MWVYGTWWLLRPAIPCLIFAATFYFTSFRDSRSSKRRRNNILSIIRKRKLSLIWPTETMVMMLMEEKTPERVPDSRRVYGQQVPVLRLLRLYPGGYKRLYYYMLLVMAFKHLWSIHSIEVLLIEYLQCERVQIRKSLRFLYYHQLSFGRLYLSVTQSIFLPSIALLCYNWQQKTTRRDPPPVLSRSVMNGGRWVIGWWLTVTEENKVYPILFTEKSISNIQRNVNWISIGFA